MRNKLPVLLACLLFTFSSVFAQRKVDALSDFKEEDQTWFGDLPTKKVIGIGLNKTYAELIADRIPSDTIIVAVIDDGLDIEHPHFKGKLWTNPNEIPGNRIDDDQNGYADDVHGWNFTGNRFGKPQVYNHYRFTRVVRKSILYPDSAIEGLDSALVKLEQATEQAMKRLASLEETAFHIGDAYESFFESYGFRPKTLKQLTDRIPFDRDLDNAYQRLYFYYYIGLDIKTIDELIDDQRATIDVSLNPNIDPRAIVGDDPEDISDTKYGNGIVNQGRNRHGTSVASLIVLNVDEGKDTLGIAAAVRIMPIRCFASKGFALDKDLALGIRYAVDNGAQIINISLGSHFHSPNEIWVQEAVQYARDKGVIIVHAAGNSAIDHETKTSYPSRTLPDSSKNQLWLEVGASGYEKGKYIPAVFSDYGKEDVDLFAPGKKLIAAYPDAQYTLSSGTSFAAPVVSGACALLMSHFPELSPEQIIEAILSSVTTIEKPKSVLRPQLQGTRNKKVPFTDLCRTGGVLNVYQAFITAEKMAENLEIEDQEVKQ